MENSKNMSGLFARGTQVDDQFVSGGVNINTKSSMNLCSISEEPINIGGQPGANPGTTSFMNIVGIGVPFLAYNFEVDRKFLSKHNLKMGEFYMFPNTSKEILLDALAEYGSQLNDFPVKAGGVSLDIAQIIQWISPTPKSVVFLGARAMDEDALTLIEVCRKTKVGFRLEEVENITTSTVLVLHLRKRHSEIFYVDRRTGISTLFMDKPSVTKLLERANIIYTSDLSMLLMPKANQKLAYFSCSRFNHFFVILHRPICLIKAKEEVSTVLSYTDIIFLNKKTANTFIKIFNVPCCKSCRKAWDIYLFMKDLSKKSCTVIVSDGITSAIVHTDLCTGSSARYKSKFTKKSMVVDRFGVERAFVAGFMAMMIQGHTIDPCIECGFFCSSLISVRFGISLPENSADVLAQWHNYLDKLLGEKSSKTLSKRESNLPFTLFHTPWKETDVSAVCTDVYGSSKDVPQSPV